MSEIQIRGRRTGFAALLVLLAAGLGSCSAEQSEGGPGGPPGSGDPVPASSVGTGTGADSAVAPTADGTGNGTGTGTGTGTVRDAASATGPDGGSALPAERDAAEPPVTVNGCLAPGSTGSSLKDDVDLEFSYIWIANAEEGTVSKLDTRTVDEVARYIVRPDSAGSPSRTSVNLNGDMAVANRLGGVTKIYARLEDCVDRNGDGTIQTSSGPSDVLAWDEDECVAWYTDFQFKSQRPIAWTRGELDPVTCKYEHAKVWTSGTNADCTGGVCEIEVIRLNGDTGAVEERITVAGLAGTDFLATMPGIGWLLGAFGDGHGGYGGAADGEGHFWIFVSSTTQLVRVDAETLQYRAWDIPDDNGYGITLDSKGRPWICGSMGVARFDPTTETWETNPAVDNGFNGCMTDGDHTLWAGGGGDFGTPSLKGVDTETLQLINEISTGGGVKGVSIDYDGYIWGVEKGDRAWRADPVTHEVLMYNGLTGAYSYSDMTGFALRQAGTIVPVLE